MPKDRDYIYEEDQWRTFKGPFLVERHRMLHSLAKRGQWLRRLLFRPAGRLRERIVEYPLAIAAMASLPAGSRVADIGGASSLLGLELTALGHEVTVLDLRDCPLRHPRLHAMRKDLFQADLPAGSFDGITCISVIEHVGFARYGGTATPDGDMAMMAHLARLCRPGGVLALSAPYGRGHDQLVEGKPYGFRFYDRARLSRLCKGFEVHSLRFFTIENGCWVERSQDAADTVATTRPVSAIFLALLTPTGAG